MADDSGLAASKVRLWAESEAGKKWLDHKDMDLWLVLETGPNGEHYYLAPKMETFTFTFEARP